MKFTQYVKDYLAKNPDSGLTYREAMKDDGVRCAYKQFEADMCKQGYVRETEKRPTPKRTYNKNTPAVENITINYDAPPVPQPSAPKSLPVRPPREIKQAQPAQQPPMSMYAQENPLLEKFYDAIDKRTLPAPVPQPPQPQPINVNVPPVPAPVFNMPPINVAPPAVNVAPPNVNVAPAPVNVNVPPPTIPKELIDMWLRWEQNQLKGDTTPPPNIINKAANYGGNVLNDVVSWLSRKRDVIQKEEEEELEDDDFAEPLDPETGEQYKSYYPPQPTPTNDQTNPYSLPNVSGQVRQPTQTITNVQTPVQTPRRQQQYTDMPQQYTGQIPTSIPRRDEGYGNALYGRSPVMDMSNAQLAESIKRRKEEEERRKAALLLQQAQRLENTDDQFRGTNTITSEVSDIVTGRTSTPGQIAAYERMAKKNAEAEAKKERERQNKEKTRAKMINDFPEYSDYINEQMDKSVQEEGIREAILYDLEQRKRSGTYGGRKIDDSETQAAGTEEQRKRAAEEEERNKAALTAAPTLDATVDKLDNKQKSLLKAFEKKQKDEREKDIQRKKEARGSKISEWRQKVKEREKTDAEIAEIYATLLIRKGYLENALKFDRGNPNKEDELARTEKAIEELQVRPAREIADVYKNEYRIEVGPSSVSDATTVESGSPSPVKRREQPMGDQKRVRTGTVRTNLEGQFAQAAGMGFDDKKEKLKHILHALIDVSL